MTPKINRAPRPLISFALDGGLPVALFFRDGRLSTPTLEMIRDRRAARPT